MNVMLLILIAMVVLLFMLIVYILPVALYALAYTTHLLLNMFFETLIYIVRKCAPPKTKPAPPPASSDCF